MEEKIKDILFQQLELLLKESRESVVSEPGLAAKNALAMVEIAKLFRLYPMTPEFDELL